MSPTEQDEPWYDAEDISEWEEVLRAAVRAAHDATERAQDRLTRFQYLVLQLRCDHAAETRDLIRKGLAELVGVPLMPRPLPTQPERATMSLAEIEAANEARRASRSVAMAADRLAEAKRAAVEEARRLAKIEEHLKEPS